MAIMIWLWWFININYDEQVWLRDEHEGKVRHPGRRFEHHFERQRDPISWVHLNDNLNIQLEMIITHYHN